MTLPPMARLGCDYAKIPEGCPVAKQDIEDYVGWDIDHIKASHRRAACRCRDGASSCARWPCRGVHRLLAVGLTGGRLRRLRPAAHERVLRAHRAVPPGGGQEARAEGGVPPIKPRLRVPSPGAACRMRARPPLQRADRVDRVPPTTAPPPRSSASWRPSATSGASSTTCRTAGPPWPGSSTRSAPGSPRAGRGRW